MTHPWSCLLWTSVVLSVAPEHKFTTLAIARNTISNLHRDMNNHEQSQNLVISVCSQTCSGGAIWVADETGDTIQAGAGRGRILPLCTTGIFFNPRSPHFTFDFEGARLVAVAYHIRQSWRLSEDLTRKILNLGFAPIDVAPAVSDPYQI